MNVDRILETLNRCDVSYILIGGMNYLLRHEPVLTYDVDIWIEDSPENLERSAAALAELDAEWGSEKSDWGPVAEKPAGWLGTQAIYCLTSPHGSIDVFRSVRGLSDWATSAGNASRERTAAGVPYLGLSDEDMLACQMALDVNERKQSRIERLLELTDGQ